MTAVPAALGTPQLALWEACEGRSLRYAPPPPLPPPPLSERNLAQQLAVQCLVTFKSQIQWLDVLALTAALKPGRNPAQVLAVQCQPVNA